MSSDHMRPRRSALYVPAGNGKAVAKAATLACDAVIFDLEDAVAPESKRSARESLRGLFAKGRPASCETVIRINPLGGEWGVEDLLAAVACRPDAILIPKVATPRDIHDVDDALDECDADDVAIWAMVETPRAMLNIGAIAELGRDRASRLACLVAGINDLVSETGVEPGQARENLKPWLLHLVLAARAGGLGVLDGVYNDFSDADGFTLECGHGAAMGFDGKTLIHPAQIELANAAFTPPLQAITAARAIVDAFAMPDNAGKAVLALDGQMIERLHLKRAERLLARAGQTVKLQ